MIGGTVLAETRLLSDAVKKKFHTPYGDADVHLSDDVAFIQRHGDGIPPHRINHRANMWALREHSDTVVGVGSVGSLTRRIKPPSIVVPDDYIHLEPPTYFDDEIVHVTPGFDSELRKRILEAAFWNRIKVVDGGVYVQTRGPRLETRAEVRMLSNVGDIVGMTVASEATLAAELGVKYAAVCQVDNLAHGLEKKKPDYDEIREYSMKNNACVEALVEKLVGGVE